MQRRVFSSLGCMLLAVLAGLAWSYLPLHLPYFAWKYGGSILWAVALFFLMAALVPGRSPRFAAMLAVAISPAVELSRRISLPVWVHFRHTLAGRLLIGNIFSARNIVAYWAGIALAFGIDSRRR